MSNDDRESWPSSAERFETARPRARSEGFPKRVAATFSFLLGCIPRRKAGRRTLGVLTILMAFVGVALLSYPFVTDFWAHSRQSKLKNELHSKQSIEAFRSHTIAVGGALTRLIIPKFSGCASCKGVNVIVVQGTSGNALRAGAGHYVDTPLPGEQGNVAIAGHRTGFGEPFRHIDALRPGDLIILDTPIGKFTYKVVPPFDGHGNPWVTNPLDFSVVAPTPEAALTLTSCDPPHTSKNRLIVRADLVQSAIPTG